jgi:hypothetical protein
MEVIPFCFRGQSLKKDRLKFQIVRMMTVREYSKGAGLVQGKCQQDNSFHKNSTFW